MKKEEKAQRVMASEVDESLNKGASVPEAPLSTSTVNDGLDCVYTVVGRTIDDVAPSISSSFRVVQLGLREEFIPLDDVEGIQDSTGETFAVLKK